MQLFQIPILYVARSLKLHPQILAIATAQQALPAQISIFLHHTKMNARLSHPLGSRFYLERKKEGRSYHYTPVHYTGKPSLSEKWNSGTRSSGLRDVDGRSVISFFTARS
jgi:hypothetical protein